MTSRTRTNQLRALGFCGADDSVNPKFLAMICHSYPVVEFGVLFRSDKEGEPRYASMAWVQQLSDVSNRMKCPMNLAAHLCGSRVNDVLDGSSDDFLEQLVAWKFGRVQINATAVNGVDTSRLNEAIPTFVRMVEKFNNLEFIIQKNEETRSLWEGLEIHYSSTSSWPSNLSMLFDESKGTGVATKCWPNTNGQPYEIGYAGGIGPSNVRQVLPEVSSAAGQDRKFWIDMESSLRSIRNGKDIFDLDKCFEVIEAACELGFVSRPDYLG